MSKEDLTIPGWFVTLLTGAVTLAVPFALWLTASIYTMQSKVESLQEVRDTAQEQDELIRSLTSSIDRLTGRLHSYEGDIIMMQALRERASRNEARLDDVDKRLIELQRKVK